MAGGSLEDFEKILKDQNTKWATARDANEELKAFLATPEAEQYKDEKFAKKADFYVVKYFRQFGEVLPTSPILLY